MRRRPGYFAWKLTMAALTSVSQSAWAVMVQLRTTKTSRSGVAVPWLQGDSMAVLQKELLGFAHSST
jgi:hypothetical protein